MKIAILTGKGIEKIVNKILDELPLNERLNKLVGLTLNERFQRVKGHSTETAPYDIRVLPRHSSYCQGIGNKSRIIDLLGPYEDVPSFGAVSSTEEQKRIEKERWHKQNQLVVLNNGVYFMHLILSPHHTGILTSNVEGVYFSPGYHGSENEKQYTSILWEPVVEGMVDYFLKQNLLVGDSHKVIFGSERGRDKIIKTFDKLELKQIVS